jgi:hypothetical protein
MSFPEVPQSPEKIPVPEGAHVGALSKMARASADE